MNELEPAILPEDGAEMLEDIQGDRAVSAIFDLEELQDLTRCPICWGEFIGFMRRYCIAAGCYTWQRRRCAIPLRG